MDLAETIQNLDWFNIGLSFGAGFFLAKGLWHFLLIIIGWYEKEK